LSASHGRGGDRYSLAQTVLAPRLKVKAALKELAASTYHLLAKLSHIPVDGESSNRLKYRRYVP
jgi:hypothetical protein